MKNILILGANGFIGSNLAKTLVNSSGDEELNITCFDYCETEIDKRVDGVNYITGDFFDDDTLKSIIKCQDVIYHAISTLNPGNSNDMAVVGYERDFIQTVKLCDWIKDTEAKLIFLSSGGTVYGKQDRFPIKEDALPRPINHYGNVKLCIENALRVYHIQSDAKYLVVRISNPYGPGQDSAKGVGFIDAAVRRAIKGEPVEIWGDGSVVRDYIYIDDVCKVLARLGLEECAYDTVNISSGKGISLREIVDIINEIVPLEVVYKPSRTVDSDINYLDNTRMRELFSDDLVDLKDGIASYYNYLLNN